MSSVVIRLDRGTRGEQHSTRGVIQLEGMQVGFLYEENVFAALKKEMA